MDARPDPDELLKHLQAEEPTRGRLKVFVGYAAGVGKTYAMLEAAHQRCQQGVDVVVGYVETHGRTETEALLRDLEIVPHKIVEYRGVYIHEMDVNAILARKPALALVDEFAHTNAPGSRHRKRYLDVEELLDAGIDVYTTLNIQHLESLNDVVAQVTGVVVRETIPDRLMDEASEIEIIDLPPDELLARLREGKVYVPDQAARAIEKFFRKGNLTALREMSLRRAAERVDSQMRAYMQTRSIPGPWPAGDRLLVCISPNLLAEKLIRTTRRLADELGAEWVAVYVNIVSKPELNPAYRERIGKNLLLAEELGGKALTLAGRSIHDAVLDYAHQHNITKIVVGKPLRPRWQEWWTGSVVEQLVRASGDIDIYVINSRPESDRSVTPEEWRPHHPLRRYLFSLGIVGLATLLGVVFRARIEPANLVMFYLVGVVISALYLGRGPSLLAALTGVLVFDFFLVPPYLTFVIDDTQYLFTFVGLFIVSLVISTLTVQVREQAEFAIQRETQTATLYNLSRDLASADRLEQVAQTIIRHLGDVFGREAVIFWPDKEHLHTLAATPGYEPDENDLAVAQWAYEHNQPAGLGTNTLPAAALRCQPLKTANGLMGILGIHPRDTGSLLTPEQRQVLDAFANQAALALERAELAESARQAELIKAAEKLQAALLNSISHDLRTPLVAITGALSALEEDGELLDENARQTLVENARTEADRLNRLVGNLLNMTRIEAGALKLMLEPCEVSDLLNSALEVMESRLQSRRICLQVASDLPLIRLDFVLIVQVLVNLLDNGLKYSSQDQSVEITAWCDEDVLLITVDDHGPGIPPDDLERIFDKFYRVQRPGNISGTGLGLSICKGIVEAHNGRIRAENRPGGGTRFLLSIPISETK